jgi:hypothetical protein
MHGRIAPDLDATGKVRGLYCTEYDIHDLKLTEQALAAREEQLRLFTTTSPSRSSTSTRSPVLVRQRGVPAALRPRARRGDRQAADEVLGLESAQALAPGRERVITEGERSRTSARCSTRTDRTRWIRARCVPDLNFDGTVKGEYVVGHDITDLKIAQTRSPRARASCARSWTACPRRSRTSTARSTATTSTHVPPVFRPDRRAGAELRLRDVVGHGIYQSAQAMLTARSRANRPRSTGWCRAPTACAAG